MNTYSNLAITSAVVMYLLAFVAHTIEWASARSIPQPLEAAARRTNQIRERELVTTGGAVPREPGPADRAPLDAGPLVEDRPPQAGAGPRVEMFGRLGVTLTVMAFILALAGVVLRGVAADRAPWGNMYEFVITAMVIIVGAYLVLARVWKMRWLGLPVTLLATVANGLAITVFYVAAAPLVPALKTYWFLIHIMAATLAGAAFNVGGIASILYLVKARRERQAEADAGGGASYLDRMPSGRKLDMIAYRFHAFAFPMWTFAVAAGSVWAEYAWGRYWGWDPKETWALVTWIIYACYLHARSTAGWRGKAAAVIAIIGMVSFWFNFIGVNLLFTGLHSYAGI